MNTIIIYFRIKLKISMIYKISTLSNLFGQVIQMFLLFFFWTQVYNAEIYTLQYVMWSRVVYCFICGNSVWNLADDIKSGNIVIKLIQPRRYFQHTLYIYIASQLVNVIFAFIPLAIMAYVILPINFQRLQILLCIISIFSSIIICYCFDYIISLGCIFTHNTWGISSFRDGIVQILSGSIVPLYFFHPILQDIIYCFPFAYMVDTPVKILLENDINFVPLLRQAFYCILMMIAVFFAENWSLKKLQIQGG